MGRINRDIRGFIENVDFIDRESRRFVFSKDYQKIAIGTGSAKTRAYPSLAFWFDTIYHCLIVRNCRNQLIQTSISVPGERLQGDSKNATVARLASISTLVTLPMPSKLSEITNDPIGNTLIHTILENAFSDTFD